MVLFHLDNSQLVSETTIPISGDMEVNDMKNVDESIVVEPSKVNDSSEPQQPIETLPLHSDAKDEDIEECEVEPTLSRNSSQNGPKVYDKEFLLSLRDQASDHAISISHDNIKDIVKRVISSILKLAIWSILMNLYVGQQQQGSFSRYVSSDFCQFSTFSKWLPQ